MSRRKTRAEDIRNPEHYFNRMVALEHLRDEQDTAKYIKQFPSLEAMIESGNEGPGHNSVMLLAVNENGEEFDRYITHASMLGWLEVIDYETLYQAIYSLSYEDKLLLTFRQIRCRAIPTQAETALASCPAMIPSAHNDTPVLRLREFLGGVRVP